MPWNAKDGATQIRTARSRDGGGRSTTPMTLQTAGAPAIAAGRRWRSTRAARAHAIWLDHRGTGRRGGTLPASTSQHKGAKHDGVAMAQKSGPLLRRRRRACAERELFKGVCYCCKTAMAAGADGEIFAAWRHVYAGNMRDMAFTHVARRRQDVQRRRSRVSEDGWRSTVARTTVRRWRWMRRGRCTSCGRR